MGQTDIYKLRWPERTGVAADGPDGYKDLATDVEDQMIRMRTRTFATNVTTTDAVPILPGKARTLFELNLAPPVAGWVQVEWWWSAQWRPGTWHGGRVTGTLGVPGLAQSFRAQRWANYGFAMNGQMAGRLANPTTNRLGQRFQLVIDTDPGSDPNGNFIVPRAGYCVQYYGGNPVALTNTYQIGHGDYNSSGARVTTYTLTPEPATAVGDWVYLVHLNYREPADISPSMPAGFVQVVAPQVGGTTAAGIQWTIWRKKRTAGDLASYTVTLPSARFVKATLITVRSPNDNVPVLSAFTAARAGVNPARLTVPGNVAVQPGALVLTFAFQDAVSMSAAQPLTATGATVWYSVPQPDSTATMIAVATRSYATAMNTDPVVFAWPSADAGRIGGVSLIFPPT